MRPATYIHLHSRDAKIGKTSIEECEYHLPITSATGFNYSTISLYSMSFINSVPGVNENNNVISISENNGVDNISITITPGVYSGAEFATKLATDLSAVSARTYTVTYNEITKKFTFTISATNFRFNTATTANKVLGLTTTQLDGDYDTTLTSGGIINLSGTKYIYVCSNLSTNNLSSNGRNDVLAIVPIFQGYGVFNFYESLESAPQFLRNRDIDTIQIKLYDEDLRPYKLSEHSDYVLTLKLE